MASVGSGERPSAAGATRTPPRRTKVYTGAPLERRREWGRTMAAHIRNAMKSEREGQ